MSLKSDGTEGLDLYIFGNLGALLKLRTTLVTCKYKYSNMIFLMLNKLPGSVQYICSKITL